MIVKMAKQYRRPLLTFYMSAPPRKGDRGHDFRTLPDSYSAAQNALVDALIRDVKARQGMVRATMVDEDEAEPLSFVGTATVSDGVPALVASIQNMLGFDRKDFRVEISGGSDVQLAGFESKNVKPSYHMVSRHKMDFETYWKLYLAGPSTSLSTL